MGRYVNRNLLKDEAVLHEAHIHWSFWIGPALIILANLAAGILLVCFGKEKSPVLIYCGYFFFAMAVITWLQDFIEYKSTEVVVTNKRLVIKRGFIARKTFELLLQKTETVGVDQGVMGRILNFGTVTAIGTGGSHGSIDYISKPMAFRAAFQEAVELHQESDTKAVAQ